MKILIYGAGVLGSLLASLLKRSGQEVSILARGERYRQIKENGLILQNMVDNTWIKEKVNVVENGLTQTSDFDLIIVLMQKNQISAILPDLAKYSPHAYLLFMGNNATGIEDYRKVVNESRILLGFFSAAGKRNGEIMQVVYDPRGTRIHIGEPSGLITSRIKQIQEVLASTGTTIEIPESIDAWLKCHVAKVSPLSNLYYMLKTKKIPLREDSPEIALGIQAVREAVEVLKTLKYPILPASFAEEVADPAKLQRAIMFLFNWEWFEIALKGHVDFAVDEMRYLADEFRKLIDRAGLETPAFSTLYQYIP